jgi:hypothetical protein
MSDLDESLSELRADLRSSLRKPGLPDVAGRARQRSVRRRMQFGAIAAVVVVSVSVPVLRSVPDDHPAAPPKGPHYEYQLDFADRTHGYALGSRCGETSCRFRLLASADGGQTWQLRQLPADDGSFTGAGLAVLGPAQVSVWRYSKNADTPAVNAVSDDAGRTWGEPQHLTGAPPRAEALPAGALIGQTCIGQGAGGDCQYGVAATTMDNVSVQSPTQPPLLEPDPGSVATAGGRIWVAGRGYTGGWAISVSSDRGRTWLTTPLDLPGEPSLSGGWSVSEQGQVMYLTVIGSIGVGPTGLLAIYRSTNKGVTWNSTWRATAVTVRQGVLGGTVTTADGDLLVYSTIEGTLVSGDGRTFRRATHQLPGEVTWTRGGYLSRGSDNSFELSADGVHWRTGRLE